MSSLNYTPDHEKIKAMDREDLEKIVNNIAGIAHAFHSLDGERGNSLMEFFTAYILSPEYQSKDRSEQIRIFENYDYSKYAINTINDLMSEYRLSETHN